MSKEELNEVTEETPVEESEETDTELKDLIDLQVKEVLGEQKRQLEEKAEAHMRKQREMGVDTSAHSRKEGKRVVREFLKALSSNDYSYLKEYKQKTQNVSNDSEGGYLVPEILTEEIARIPEDYYGVARNTMRVWQFSGPGNERELPVLDQNVTASWIGESNNKPGTKLTLTRPTLSMKKLAAIVPMTEEIIEDSAIDLQSFVAEVMVEQFAKKEDQEFFSTGDGEFTGILDDTNLNFLAEQADPADLTADHLADLQMEVSTAVRRSGTYYMHPTVFNVIRKLKDNEGQYIVQMPTEGRPGTIWDRPYVLVDGMRAVGEVGTDESYIVFGNLRWAASYGEKQGIRSRLLDQATVNDSEGNPIHLAMQDLVALRFMKRVGYVLHQPKALAAIKSEVS